MVLFVVLYSMGQTDVQRYKQLADGLREAFAGGGPLRIVDPGIDQSGGSEEDTAAAPIIIPGIPQAPIDSVEVAGELTEMLASTNLGGAVSIQNNVEGVLISVGEKLLFAPGTASLQKDAYAVLDTIAGMILPLENEVRIIGHTDNSPPVDPKYASNWELSVGRANVIAQYFIERGVPAGRLVIAGRGDQKPVFPNDTPEHRALNSRAEIVVIYSLNQDVINLDLGAPSQPTLNEALP
jgi:chemotaxis protein MotB